MPIDRLLNDKGFVTWKNQGHFPDRIVGENKSHLNKHTHTHIDVTRVVLKNRRTKKKQKLRNYKGPLQSRM